MALRELLTFDHAVHVEGIDAWYLYLVPKGWTEREAAPHFVAELEGMDVARRDAAEVARFAAEVSTPARAPRPVGARVAASFAVLVAWLAWGPNRAFPLVLLLVVALVLLVMGLAGRSRGLDVPALMARVRARLQFSSPPDLARFTDRFTVSIEASALSVRGDKPGSSTLNVPVAEVDSIVGGRRISVRLTDGSTQELPCTLLDGAGHAAFAARLDEQVRVLRAAAVGYRGRLPGREAEIDENETEDPAALSGSARHSRR